MRELTWILIGTIFVASVPVSHAQESAPLRNFGAAGHGIPPTSDGTTIDPTTRRGNCGDYYDWGRAAMARGVDSNYEPINETDVFGAGDPIYAWNRIETPTRPCRTRVRWIDPDGSLFAETTSDWSADGQWDWYAWWFWYAPGQPIHDHEGLWAVEWLIEEDHEGTWCQEAALTFVSKYHIADHATCTSVQADSPWDPIRRTRYFRPPDSRAYSWLDFQKVRGANYAVRWQFVDPGGSLYSTIEYVIPDATSFGFDYWDWYRAWAWIGIAGYPPATNLGEWTVTVTVDGEPQFVDHFYVGIPCPGDLEENGSISLSDLAVLLSHFGFGPAAVYEDGDLDGDGQVGLQDLAELLSHFGTTCP